MNDALTPEKVFRVLELISERPSASQRELAEKSGFSLGLINLTLKRLIKTGHIKASALNRRKLEYLLTSKGLIEMTNRTTNYITRTLDTFSEYKHRIDALLTELVSQGHNSFALVGSGEVSSIVELLLASKGAAIRHRRIQETEKVFDGEIVLDCRLRNISGVLGVSILERLLQRKPPLSKSFKNTNSLEVVK